MSRFIELFFLYISWVITSASYAMDLNEYRQSQNNLSIPERLNLSCAAVMNEKDESVRIEAIKDMIQYAKTPEDNHQSIRILDEFLAKENLNTELQGRANLAKARFLMRLGQKEAAWDLFRRGIKEKWKENAFRELNDSLKETNQYEKLVIDEYVRNALDFYETDLQEYYGLGIDLSTFLIRLIETKIVHPETDLMERIYPFLIESARWKHALLIAKSLCWVCEDNHRDAVKGMTSVWNDVQDDPIKPREESAFVPLLFGIVLAINGRDIDLTQRVLLEYISRNENEPVHVLNRILEVVYALEKSIRFRAAIHYITGTVLNSEMIKEDRIRSKLPEPLLASLYDKHAQGLFDIGKVSESQTYWNEVVDQYFPDQLAGSNALFNLSRIAFLFENDFKKAESLCNRILYESPHENIVEHAKLLLKNMENIKLGHTPAN